MSRYELGSALTRSRASVLAAREGKASTEYPEKYLHRAAAQERRNILESRSGPPKPQLPKDLETIVSLQQKNGFWSPSDALEEALGGNVPERPEGVQTGLWWSVLCVVYLRRELDYFHVLEESHGLAMENLDGAEHLISMASDMLPPPNLSFPLDYDSMRKGKWKQVRNDGLDAYGHTFFCCEVDDGEQPRLVMQGEQAVEQRTRVRDRTGAKKSKEQERIAQSEWKRANREAHKSLREGDAIQCRWRRASRLMLPCSREGHFPKKKWWDGTITKVYKEGDFFDVHYEKCGDFAAITEKRVQRCHIRKPVGVQATHSEIGLKYQCLRELWIS